MGLRGHEFFYIHARKKGNAVDSSRFVALNHPSRNNVASVRQSTTARGYGSAHQALRKKVAALVASGNAVCWRCRRPILPWMQWDLGQDDYDRTVYRGPENRRCNS